ncbi:hypothetical protein [Pedobacter antarcticus]|uniref:hypothetical protein n=1 Tax=Pedobacter antarcticus TaxID=34086 RepID=UPI00088DBDAF|nr:hypothetical protein [Pedobacter antarcticus]SDM40878.1 hypothetical protein SAMN04488084_106180 [Pedobacter antarcticus]
MSISIITPVQPVAFSGEKMQIRFKCDQYLETDGQYAVNSFDSLNFLSNGDNLRFSYGSTEVILTATNNPDVSGYQVPSGPISIVDLLSNFQGNYQLSKDYHINAVTQSKIEFKAKRQSLGFDFDAVSSSKFSIKNEISGSVTKQKSNYGVYFRLWCENASHSGFDLIYENTAPLLFGSSGVVEIQAGDKLHEHISFEIEQNGPEVPVDMPLLCKRSCRKYFFEYAESFGDIAKIQKIFRSELFTVLHGALSTVAENSQNLLSMLRPDAPVNDRFLKQGSIESDTRKDQPQYLYFLNTRETVQAVLNCRYYFTDGSVAAIVLQTVELHTWKKYGFNVSFNHIYIPNDYPVKIVKKYEIWISNTSGVQISESRLYILDDQYRAQVRYFLNWSSFGTLDSRMFYGRGSLEFDLVQSEANQIYQNTTSALKGTSFVYDLKLQSKFKVTTGFLRNRDQLLFNRDFFVSPIKFIVNSSRWLPVKVTSKTIGEIEDGNHLYAQQFEYEYLFQDNAYTEGDIEKPIEPEERPVGMVYFGPSSTRPVTAEDVIALSNRQAADIYLFPLYTGLNRFFIVASPANKGIGNVYNQTADENLTSEYIAVQMQIDGLTYKVAIMEMAIAYSINNDHIITLKNE